MPSRPLVSTAPNNATVCDAWRSAWPLVYAQAMINMATIEDLYRQEHSLGLYCVVCDRWGAADLAQLIECGQGGRPVVGTRFRCRDCGALVEKQVRPPVPQVGGAAAYI